jgi:hypothetical protein
MKSTTGMSECKFSVHVNYNLKKAIFMFYPSVAGNFMHLIYLTSYWTANRAYIQGVYNEFLSKYYATMIFIFKSRKQEDIFGNLWVTKICYAISSSNVTPKTYRAVQTLHNKYGSMSLWLIFRLETSATHFCY